MTKLDELKAIVREILDSKRVADTTPEMLLSSRHEKSDECGRIMDRYMQSFVKAQIWMAENDK